MSNYNCHFRQLQSKIYQIDTTIRLNQMLLDHDFYCPVHDSHFYSILYPVHLYNIIQ